ncbi:hypothetical protein MRX96_005269 [Rhipicephalus microplus]
MGRKHGAIARFRSSSHAPRFRAAGRKPGFRHSKIRACSPRAYTCEPVRQWVDLGAFPPEIHVDPPSHRRTRPTSGRSLPEIKEPPVGSTSVMPTRGFNNAAAEQPESGESFYSPRVRAFPGAILASVPSPVQNESSKSGVDFGARRRRRWSDAPNCTQLPPRMLIASSQRVKLVHAGHFHCRGLSLGHASRIRNAHASAPVPVPRASRRARGSAVAHLCTRRGK